MYLLEDFLLIVNTLTDQLPSSINVVPLNHNVEQSADSGPTIQSPAPAVLSEALQTSFVSIFCK